MCNCVLHRKHIYSRLYTYIHTHIHTYIHTAGATGMASRIAGSVGDGFAALSLNDDFQAQRRQMRAQRHVGMRALSAGSQVCGIVNMLYHTIAMYMYECVQ